MAAVLLAILKALLTYEVSGLRASVLHFVDRVGLTVLVGL